MKKQAEKRALRHLIVFSIAVLLAGVFYVIPVHGEQKVYDEVIRLHVLAASDSEQDQAMKIAVRDHVLAHSGKELLCGVSDVQQAKQMLATACSAVQDSVDRFLAEQGASYTCTVSLAQETYERRWYGTLCMPAGTYASLVIRLGEGAGQNWWCVLFPPLCVRAAQGTSASIQDPTDVSDLTGVQDSAGRLAGVGLGEEAVEMLTQPQRPHVKIKLRILELLEALFD